MSLLEGASATMQAVCAVRAQYAAELADGLAPRILGVLPAGAEVRDRLDAGSRGMFSRSVRLRSLFISNAMREATAVGAQLVVLSAGLDFRALADGSSWGPRARIFVDHPASQAVARDVLQAIDFPLAEPAAFVAMDLTAFGPGELTRALESAGLNLQERTLVIWEGATYYLEPDVVSRTLEEVASSLPRVRIVCDFLQRDAYFNADGQPRDEGAARNLEYVRRLGEPWVGFFDGQELTATFRSCGFDLVDVVAREDAERDLLGDVQMTRGTMFFVDARKGWK